MVLFVVVCLLLIAGDYLTKLAAAAYLKTTEVTLIRNVLYFTYVENRGAAFGILQNHRYIFIILTVVVVAAIIIYVFGKKPESKLFIISLALICGGGIGNLIDRISLSYVIDFIDFRLINFPVFNIADCGVVIGCALLIIYILFLEGKKTDGNS